MAKSLILPLCCLFIMQGLRAQDYKTTDNTSIPQKLELRKASLGWDDHLGYFVKKNEENDSTPSVVYLGLPRKDTIELNLPPMQASRVSLRASMHRPLPLFRIQQ
jgi:hypothetical protein